MQSDFERLLNFSVFHMLKLQLPVGKEPRGGLQNAAERSLPGAAPLRTQMSKSGCQTP